MRRNAANAPALHDALAHDGTLDNLTHLLRAVFDILPVGVWIADAKGHILLGNRAGDEIWQGTRHVGPQEYGQYQAWWAQTGLPIAAHEWGLARALERQEVSRGELIRIRCFDGSSKTIINFAAPIRSESGAVVGAVAVNQDVTALYQTQEQLRGAVHEREHILAVVAHDMRSPLGAIALHAAVAQQQARALPGAEKLRATTATLHAIARGMTGLMDDLLAISTQHSGRSMLNTRPVPPDGLISEAAKAAAPLLDEAGLRLVLEVAGGLPTVQIDHNRILRVFANLLDNAAKFTERDGVVVLQASARDNAVLFTVANTGQPLADAQLQRLFQPFWQAAQDDKRGSGLGLAICRSIVEAHGGSIWSEPADGMRVKVCMLLPCVGPVRVRPPGEAAQPGG